MRQLRVYQTQAVVIKQTGLGEADKILTLFTPDLGKVKAVAKGVRRPGSKLGGAVEPLTHSLMTLAKGRNLDIVTQSQIIDGFATLKSDLWKVSCGFYVLELVDAFAVEGSANRDMFELALDAFRYLCQDEDGGDTILRHFELHLLSMVGYCPQLHRCVGCSSSIGSQRNFFSAEQGGLLCSCCGSRDGSSHILSLRALKVLRLWQKSSYPEASRVKVDGKLAEELQQVISQYIRYILQREVKSTKWLQELKKFAVDNTRRGVYNARQSSKTVSDERKLCRLITPGLSKKFNA